MKRAFGIVLVFLLLTAVVSLIGCTRKSVEPEAETVTPTESVSPTQPVVPPPAPTPVPTTQVLVYFNRGEFVGVAGREVPTSSDTETLLQQAIEELLKGPNQDDLGNGITGTAIPSGTTLRGVSVKGRVATVDLARQFESGGGSLSMQLRVAQLVYTATQFRGVTSVAFKIDGQLVEAIGGEGVVVQPPVTRADFEAQTPPILVEHPVPGQNVSSPVDVSGTSNVFEAQFNVEVLDPAGAAIAQQPIKATSGTGTRGTFDASVSYKTGLKGQGTLVFFDFSMKDGSRIDVVEIPVTME